MIGSGTAASRRGMTLLELGIAVLVMALLFHVALEASFGVLQTSAGQRADANLAGDATTILRVVQEDLALSGWHFADLPDEGDPVADRDRLYYPMVIQQALGRTTGLAEPAEMAEGRCRPLPWFNRATAQVALDELPPGLKGNPGTGNPSDPYHVCWGDAGTWFSGDAGVSPDAGTPSPFERTLYRESFYARSQELVFLRCAIAPWTEDPAERDRGLLDFTGSSVDWRPDPAQFAEDFRWKENGILRPQDWDVEIDPTTGRRSGVFTAGRAGAGPGRTAIPEALVQGAYAFVDPSNGEIQIETRWETRRDWASVGFVDAPTGRRQIDAAHLREFTYAVIPSPVGTGRLVRAYSVDDPGATIPLGDRVGQAIGHANDVSVVIDEVLSDHVVRVVFDTYRTDPALAINEVRLQLFLAATATNDPAKGVLYHRTDATFTMRTRNNQTANGESRSYLQFSDAERRFPF